MVDSQVDRGGGGQKSRGETSGPVSLVHTQNLGIKYKKPSVGRSSLHRRVVVTPGASLVRLSPGWQLGLILTASTLVSCAQGFRCTNKVIAFFLQPLQTARPRN